MILNPQYPDVQIRYVFFDAGGTLIQPWPSVGEIYAQAARRFGREYDGDDLQNRYRRAAREMRRLTKSDDGPPYGTSHQRQFDWWRQLVGMVFPEWMGGTDFEEFFKSLFNDMERPELYRFLDGAPAVIDDLSARGYGTGLISNWDFRLRTIVEGMGLVGRLTPIVISAEVGFEKPSPRIFHEALGQAGVDGRQAAYVGDSFEWDVCGARGVGMLPILLGDDPQAPNPSDGHFMRIQSLPELLDIFR